MDVAGALSATVVRLMKPAEVWPVTARLPVTAIAPKRTGVVVSDGLRSATWSVWATLATRLVRGWLALRESTNRVGATAL